MKTNVLYVDDDIHLLRISKIYLEEIGGQFIVDTAMSAKEAEARLAAKQYDAIVSDYEMPGMNGIEFLRIVRKKYGNIPFIVYTGRGREEIVIEAINSGADFYLQKGGEPDAQFAELSHKIRQAVRNHKADLTLRESEEKFREIFNSVNDAVHIHEIREDGLPGKFIEVNDVSCEMLQYNRGDLLKKTPIDISTEYHSTPLSDIGARLLSTGHTIFETGHIRKDGTVIPVEINAHVSILNGRRVVIAVARDITDRKTAEEKLLEAKARTTTILEGIADTCYSLDNEWRFTLVNPAAEKAPFGRPAAELLGRVIWDLYPGLVGTFIHRHYLDAAAHHSMQHYEGQSPLNRSWYEVFMQGREGGVDVYMRDVTDRKTAEENFRALQHYTRNLIEVSPDPLVTISPEGRIMDVNAATEMVTGYDRTRLIGTDFSDYFTDPKKARAGYQRAFENGFVKDYRLMIRGCDGKVTPVDYNATVYRDENGVIQGIFAAARDVTELERSERALQQSEEKFHEIFNKANDAIEIIEYQDDGRPGRFLDVNDVACRMVRYSREELLALAPFEINTGSYSRPLDEIIQQLRDSGQATFETEHRRKDGGIIPVEISTHRITLQGKAVLLSIVRDISGRKKEEETLKMSEKIFHNLFNNTEVAMFRSRLDGSETLAANEKFLDLVGLTRGEVIGHPSVVYWADTDQRREMVRRLETDGRVVDFPFTMLTKKGGVRDCITSLSLYPEEGILEGSILDITRRKRAEEALRVSEEKFRAIFDSTFQFTGLLTPEGILIEVNNPALKFIGAAKEDVIDRPFWDTPWWQGDSKRVQKLQDAIARAAAGNFVRYELDLPGAGNTSMLVDFSIKPIRGPEGKVQVLITEARNISEHRKVVDALHESEARFRAIIQNSADIIRILDHAGRITYDSPASFRFLGYSLEETRGRSPLDFIHPEDRDRVSRALTEVFSGTNPGTSTEFRIRKKDGSYLEVESAATNLFGVPWVDGIVTTTRLISDRKQAERSLKRSELRIRGAMEIGNVAWWEMDCLSGSVQFHPAKAAMLGYRPEDFSHYSDFTRLIHPDDLEKAMQAMRDHLEGRVPTYDVLYRIRTSAGTYASFRDIGGITETDALGRPLVVAGFVVDMTDQKRAEAAIQLANHKLNLMMSITRHDILNNITVLQSYLSLSKKKDALSAAVSYVDEMLEVTKIMKTHVEFTRVYQQLGAHMPLWFDLKSLLRTLTVPDTIRLRVETEDREIYADALLQNVFYNLLDNTIRHGAKATAVTVSTRPDPQGLVIVWEDNGAGIPADEKNLVFERGFGKNTGLGLFLVREILGITGITIRETGSFGAGARFEILVPEGAFRTRTPAAGGEP
jgi:PAS domain S-box-containing protein